VLFEIGLKLTTLSETSRSRYKLERSLNFINKINIIIKLKNRDLMNAQHTELKAQMKSMQDNMRKKLTRLSLQSSKSMECLKKQEEKVYLMHSNVLNKESKFMSRFLRQNQYFALLKCAENLKLKKKKSCHFTLRL
jgi:hypothetical protein